MQRLILNNFGPIQSCDISVEKFTVLTGAQASGKSTIAKTIYFFKTIKEDILDIILKRNLAQRSKYTLHSTLSRQLRNKFMQLFGSSRAMSKNLYMQYFFDEDTSVKLKLQNDATHFSPNYIDLEFSTNISDFLQSYNNISFTSHLTKESLAHDLNELFHDEYETIFIPAGRSLITLLTTQLNYIYTFMDEEQKRSIDFCTQKYLERILKIRGSFSEGITGFYEDKKKTSFDVFNRNLINKCIDLVNKILKGKYQYVAGEERLILKNGRFVKINYTSSGQQESVWIFNILLYQLISGAKTFLILEEPEAHLYPDAQKDISELLAMFLSVDNAAIVTTHSPYILGAINNLLYANQIAKQLGKDRVSEIMDFSKTLPSCAAFFVENGGIKSCVDQDEMLIQNEVIDGASDEINATFDSLLKLSTGEE